MAMTEDDAKRLAEAFGELTSVIKTNSEEERKAKEAAALLAAEEKAAADAAAKFQAKMDFATKTVGALADVFITYNKEIYKGTSAAKADAAATEKLANAAEMAAAGLALLVPGGPVIKALVAGLGLVTAQLLKLGAEAKIQTGEIYKAFQDLSKVGATGAAGMQGVFDSLMKVGMGTEKFAEYIKLISDNSRDLAAIGGTVKKGSDMFTQTMSELTDEQRVQMEVLVGDRQAQAEAGMGYIKMQRLLTAGTRQQMDMSSASVMRYIKETDELTRLTGLNRQEQEKQRDEAMRQEVFRATINDLVNQGKTTEAKNIQTVNAMLAAYPKQQKAFQSMIGGFIGSSEEAADQFFVTGGASADFAEQLKSGAIQSMPELLAGFKKFGGAVGEGTQKFSNLAKMNAFATGVGGDFAENLDLAGRAATLSIDDIIQAQNDQKGALEAGQKMATAENDARNAQLNLQKTLNLGMESTIDGIAKRAAADRKVTEAALKAATALGKIAGEGDEQLEAQDKMNRAQMTATEKLESYSAGAIESVGQLIGKGLSLINTQAGQYVQNAAGEATKSRMTSETAYLQSQGRFKAAPPVGGGAATGGSAATGVAPTTGVTPAAGAVPGGAPGAKSSGAAGQVTGKTEGVNDQLLSALSSVAAEFGSPIRVNSGLRTIEEQQKMYNEWWEGGGKNGQATVNTPSFGNITTPAKPGSSRHQHGDAVDIDRTLAERLDTMGLLAKNGLARPVAGDPVHIQLAQMETGGFLEAGKLAIAGENGKPEIIQGPANVTSNNDIMNAFNNLASLLERSVMVQETIARSSATTADLNSKILSYAQN